MNKTMKTFFRNSIYSLALALTLAVTAANAQFNFPRGEQRWPADQTIADLKAVSAHNTYNSREMERYDSAMTHLSQFAEKLHQGHFDKGKLDHGINDVQNILNKNPMDGRARDILNHDLGELRRLRATYRIPY
jgi:hypothetical protein